MIKLNKFLKAVGTLALSLTLLAGFSANVNAAEESNEYLPEGWTRISSSTLSDEEIAQLKHNVSSELKSDTQREAAPPLTSVKIIDLALDQNNEIHVVVQEMGTSKSRSVYWNGRLCPENTSEVQYITQGSWVVGYVRYFHSGVIYSPALSGTAISTSATFINARSPYNQIGASQLFNLP